MSAPTLTGRVMLARYDGKCCACGGAVRAKETRIEYRPSAPRGQKVRHADCELYAARVAREVAGADELDRLAEERKRLAITPDEFATCLTVCGGDLITATEMFLEWDR